MSDIQRLQQRVTGLTKALIWLAIGVVYASAMITSLVMGAIAGWGLWALLFEVVSLPFAILLVNLQLAKWELHYLRQQPVQSPVSEPVQEVPGDYPLTPVYEPPVQAQVEYPGYAQGYSPQ
jgi:hypothetical protein